MANPKKTTIRPVDDRLVVKPDEPLSKTNGGIIVPDVAQDKSTSGVVVAIGPGRLLDNGRRADMGVELGDKVMFSKFSGTDISVDGEELVILRVTEILSIVDEHEDDEDRGF